MMLMKQEPTNTPSSPTPTTTPAMTYCGNCGVEERRFLHHVRHLGFFRRLCTTCVLRLNPHSFCPTCFHVYEQPHRSSPDCVTCFKCYSVSHSRCVGPNPGVSPYVCPICSLSGSSSSQIFSLTLVESEGCFGIDKKAAIVLLAAAKIAASSMKKAAVSTRAEAEKKAREASVARKRAREALDHVASLLIKEKLKKRERLASAELSGSGVKFGSLDKNLPKTGNGIVEVEAGSGTNARLDRSTEVLAALNAVELGGNERLPGFRAQKVLPRITNNGMLMDVEESNKLGINHIPNFGKPGAPNHALDKENDRSDNLGHIMSRSAQGETPIDQKLVTGNENTMSEV